MGIGQPDSIAKYGIGESVGRSGIVEDDYGISVKAERSVHLLQLLTLHCVMCISNRHNLSPVTASSTL